MTERGREGGRGELPSMISDIVIRIGIDIYAYEYLSPLFSDPSWVNMARYLQPVIHLPPLENYALADFSDTVQYINDRNMS